MSTFMWRWLWRPNTTIKWLSRFFSRSCLNRLVHTVSSFRQFIRIHHQVSHCYYIMLEWRPRHAKTLKSFKSCQEWHLCDVDCGDLLRPLSDYQECIPIEAVQSFCANFLFLSISRTSVSDLSLTLCHLKMTAWTWKVNNRFYILSRKATFKMVWNLFHTPRATF